MMRRVLSSALFILCIFINFAYSQKSSEPELVGTWRIDYEDYGEFIYHKVERFAFYYLKDNPSARIVARLCSKEKMSVALADSDGYAFYYPEYAKMVKVPADRIFFARWSKCERKSEQYWFVPANDDIQYDEMIPAARVRVSRLLVGYHDDISSPPARREFAENLKEFIAELKRNPKAEGFIINNTGTKKRYLTEALQQLRNEKINKHQFRILRKRSYRGYYPEFRTVTITDL